MTLMSDRDTPDEGVISTGSVTIPPLDQGSGATRFSAARETWRRHIAPLLQKSWLRIAILLTSAFVVHLPSLQGQLIWDDNYLLGESPFFRSPIFCVEVFHHYLFLDSFSGHYRPVQNVSYMLDYLIWNGDLYGYHLSNVIWHGAAGVLLFLLLRILLTRWAGDDESRRRLDTGAFLVALLWVLHPVHSAAVDYISGRADSLAFVFSCGAWLAYLRATGSRHKVVRVFGYAAASVLLLLGLCSREIAFVWAAIFVAHLLFVRKPAARHKIIAVAAVAIVLAAYAGLRQLPGGRDTQSTAGTWGPTARAGLVLRALGDYVRLTVLPTSLHMERSVTEHRMHGPRWNDRLALTPLSFVGLLAAAGLVAGGFKRGCGRPLRIFGAAWFLFGFLPISNIVELNATAAEHWLYLPLAGLLVVFLGWAIELPRRGFQIATICSLVFAAALGVRSTIRSSDWLDAKVFYERTIAAGGWSPRVSVNLAMIYSNEGRLDESRRLLERSLASWPDYPLARTHLAVVLYLQGATAQADEMFAAVAAAAPQLKRAYPRTWTASIQLARRAVAGHRDEDALRILSEARSMEPKVWQLAQMESEILRRTRGPEAALPVIEEFAKQNWWQYAAYLALGKLKAQQGDGPAALAALTHASRLDIRETQALNLTARIQLRANNLPAALRVQQRAVGRQPDEPSQYILFSEVLTQMGRTEQAAEARETARRLEQQGRQSA